MVACEQPLGNEMEPEPGIASVGRTVVLLDAVARADIPQLDAVVGRGGDEVPDTVCEYEANCRV